jgi:hypothetical protein
MLEQRRFAETVLTLSKISFILIAMAVNHIILNKSAPYFFKRLISYRASGATDGERALLIHDIGEVPESWLAVSQGSFVVTSVYGGLSQMRPAPWFCIAHQNERAGDGGPRADCDY